MISNRNLNLNEEGIVEDKVLGGSLEGRPKYYWRWYCEICKTYSADKITRLSAESGLKIHRKTRRGINENNEPAVTRDKFSFKLKCKVCDEPWYAAFNGIAYCQYHFDQVAR